MVLKTISKKPKKVKKKSFFGDNIDPFAVSSYTRKKKLKEERRKK